MNKDVEKIFVDILQTELNLPSDYGDADSNDPYTSKVPSIIIGYQDALLGKIDDLQVVVQVTDVSVMANNNYYDYDTNEEVQQIIQLENVQIDLMSADNTARTRRWEVMTALNSRYSLEKQDEYGFKIYRIPTSFVNVSEQEGTRSLQRFSLVVPCFVHYEKRKGASYYDNFETRGDDEITLYSNWSDDETYNTDDIVLYLQDRKYYKCLNDGVTSLPTDVTDWDEITDPSSIFEFTL